VPTGAGTWRWLVLAALVGLPASASRAPAAMPDLPAGSRTRWVVEGPEEIVTDLAFDPDAVRDRLPSGLRFVTVGELADGGVPWAARLLGRRPALASWGVSFLEIVRARTFTVDGRAPRWPRHGAVALWFARVAPADAGTDLGPGRPFLALEFWVPDRAYAGYMRDRGYPAGYGDVRLRRERDGHWLGTVRVRDLDVTAACAPAGPVVGGPMSAGMQVFLPPVNATVTDTIRVAFAGHREQACGSGTSWELRGAHPIVGAVLLGETTYQYGYHLVGGTYPR
jgi:hypothetical protein